jgi:hypothetical protein
MHHGILEYLVKWLGYPEAESTWERESQFVDLTPIEQYWNSITQPSISGELPHPLATEDATTFRPSPGEM